MLSYMDLQIFNILQTVFIVVVIVLNINIHNKLIDRVDELEKQLEEKDNG
jgi:phage regulator Rha-like protein